MHNLRDTLNIPDAGDEQISAAFLQALAEFATRQQIPPNSFVDATGVYQRPVAKQPRERVSFYALETIPAYAVFYGTAGSSNDDDWRISGWTNFYWPGTLDPGGVAQLYVNGPDIVSSGAIGDATTARGLPVWCLYDSSFGNPAVGETWGPTDDGKLRPGLPGFRATPVIAQDPLTGDWRGVFFRDWSPTLCKAALDHDVLSGDTFVDAYPFYKNHVYNGSDWSPDLTIRVHLRCPPG
ncbi:MAG TPA: hypothetical protein PK867_26825, partial [Pirellulales bacterium]|nr:hypothetical protein [Pirellulales bacterium]